ncbi:MAG: hypothetical protein WAX89_05940 [Alphaproteobacteria bacterium]
MLMGIVRLFTEPRNMAKLVLAGLIYWWVIRGILPALGINLSVWMAELLNMLFGNGGGATYAWYNPMRLLSAANPLNWLFSGLVYTLGFLIVLGISWPLAEVPLRMMGWQTPNHQPTYQFGKSTAKRLADLEARVAALEKRR